jgi:hypothetical protein
MQIRAGTQLILTDQGQSDLSISLLATGPVVQNAQQTRVQLQSNTLTLWSAADPSTAVSALDFVYLYADQQVDVELGADAPPPATPAATPPFLWTVRVEPNLPLVLLSSVVMPAGLGTAAKAITRVRVQESQGNVATVHFMVG